MISETWIIPLLVFLTFIWAIFFFFFTRAQNDPQPPLPPGPKGLPIVGNLLSLDPQLHTYFATLAQAHGPVFSLRLGSKLGVVISSASQAREVLKDHDLIFANRDAPIAGIIGTYGGHNIVWAPYGPTWRLLRKVCVREMLGASTLDALSGLRHREMRRMIGGLSEKVGTGKTAVNFGEEVFTVVARVVTETLWGGSMAASKKKESIESEFRKAVSEFTELLGVPNVSDFFPSLAQLDLQGVGKRMNKCLKLLDGIFERVIRERMRIIEEGHKREKDFLEVLLQMKEDHEGEGDGNDKVSFSIIHLKALLMDMVIGGTDTTSNTVELTMAEIMNNPEVLKKIHQELDAVVGRDNIVEEQHIYKLHYLQAVMKEALRLNPVLPLLVPHCSSESCVVGGYTIPKGSRVFINVWAIHRDPSIWPDPLKFDPERFLNSNFDFTGNTTSYLPFSSGRRICAGIAMAEKMVLFSLASLVHSFNWKIPEGEELNLQQKFGIVLSKKTPLILVPECRLSSPALYE